MNIFKYEFKTKIKSIIIWSLSITAFIIFYMAFFPSISGDSSALDSVMDSFPKEMLEALGLREGLSISSLIDYFTLTFTMVQLAIAIQSANYGFSILSQEERELTADFLMTKPVSRSRIYWSKFFAGFLSLVLTSVVIGLGSLIALQVFNGGQAYKLNNMFRLLITVPIFQLVFLSLGMVISLLFKKVRSVLTLSIGLSIGLYIINAIRGIIGNEILGYLTPFYYFEPGYILKNGDYDIKLFLIAIGLIGVSIISSFHIYNRRDINSV